MTDPRFIIVDSSSGKQIALCKDKVSLAAAEPGNKLSKCLLKPNSDGWFVWRFDKHPQPSIIINDYNDLALGDPKNITDQSLWKLTFVGVKAKTDAAFNPISGSVELNRDNFKDKIYQVLICNKKHCFVGHGQYCLFFQDFDSADTSKIDPKFVWEMSLA